MPIEDRAVMFDEGRADPDPTRRQVLDPPFSDAQELTV
jgi:hypothetical protein